MFESNLVPNHRRLPTECKHHANRCPSRNATPMNSDDLCPREPSVLFGAVVISKALLTDTDLCRWIGQTCQSVPRGSQD